MTKLDRDLDRALSGRSEPDEDLVGLVETARLFTQAFDLEPQPAFRERALFAAGVGYRRRSGFPLVRLFVPALAGLGLLAALGFASGSALPGDALYPVREVLQDVGLNEGVLADAVARMDRAEAVLDEAEDLLGDRPGRATALAVEAIQELAPVESLLEEADLSGEELALLRARLDDLIERGTSLIAGAATDEGSQDDEDQAGGVPGSTAGGEHDGDRRSDGADHDRSGSDSDDENDSSGSGDGDADGNDDDSGSDARDENDSSGSGDGEDRSGSDAQDENDSSGSGDGQDGSGSDSEDETDSSGSGDGEDRSGSDRDLIDSLDDRELDDEGDPDGEDSSD